MAPTRTRGSRLRPWLPLLAVLAQVLLLVAVGGWVDRSGLAEPDDWWGYATAVVLTALLYLSLPCLVLLGCGLAGSSAGAARWARVATLLGALVAAAIGLASLLLGAVELQRSVDPAYRVMAGGVVVTGLLPLLPLALVARRPAAGG